jgi:hypothetical protein
MASKVRRWRLLDAPQTSGLQPGRVVIPNRRQSNGRGCWTERAEDAVRHFRAKDCGLSFDDITSRLSWGLPLRPPKNGDHQRALYRRKSDVK